MTHRRLFFFALCVALGFLLASCCSWQGFPIPSLPHRREKLKVQCPSVSPHTYCPDSTAKGGSR